MIWVYRVPSPADRDEIVRVCDCGSKSRRLFQHRDSCPAWGVAFTESHADQPERENLS